MNAQLQPKVSIIAISYNHERYIKQALDSFLSQKTNFGFEIIVGDDHSTDNTVNIIKQYAAKHPDLFRLIIRPKNIGIQKNFSDSINQASGEYIALCECDDYWTDSNKLQTQVDFMDNNPQYSLCFHPVNVFFQGKKAEPKAFPDKQRFSKFDTEELLKENFIQTNSVMYRRRNKVHIPDNILPVDWYLHLYFAQFGRIGYIDKVMAAYRRHEGGIWWAKNDTEFWQKNAEGQLNMYQEVYDLYKDKPAYVKALQEPISRAMIAIAKLGVGKKDLILEAVTRHPELTANFIKYENEVQTKHRQDFDKLTQLNTDHIKKQEAIIKQQLEVIKELRDRHDAIIESRPYNIASRVGIVSRSRKNKKSPI